MDKLAEKLGLDPVEFRLRNALREGDTLDVQTPAPGPVTAVQGIEAAARRAGWKNDSGQWAIARKPKTKDGGGSPVVRGLGLAAGFKNIGFSFGYKENCWSRVEIYGKAEIERVVVYIASAEVGQ